MSRPRWGIFLVSVVFVLPRIVGADAPFAPAARGSRAETELGASLSKQAVATLPPDIKYVFSGGEGAPTISSSNVRRAILEAFPYKPSARAEPQPEQSSPILLRSQTALPDPEVVVMANLEVNERAFERGLPAAIANYRDPRPINNSRFGTGTRQKDFGKVRASVTTILYVPIFFGLSW